MLPCVAVAVGVELGVTVGVPVASGDRCVACCRCGVGCELPSGSACSCSCWRRSGSLWLCAVSPASVKIDAVIISAPDDHFTAGPHCRVIRIGASGALVVLVAVQLSVLGLYLPPVLNTLTLVIRPRRSFRCRSTLPCDAIGQRARWWCWWLSNCRCRDRISRRCSNSRCFRYIRPTRSSQLPVHTAVCCLAHPARWWCWWPSSYRCRDCICPPVFKIARDI